MSRYRKIQVRMWGDEKFCRLSAAKPNGQTLWFYLLTGPHTTQIPGLFSAGEAALAEALGWPLKGFQDASREIVAQGMVRFDWRARVVFIPKAIVYNPPESPNVILSWPVAMDQIPECDLRQEAIAHLGAYVEGMGKAFREAFAKAFGEAWRHPMANQEQEQEQEQENPPVVPPDGGTAGLFSSADGGGEASETDGAVAWLDMLNRLASRTFRPVDANLRPIRARIREGYTAEQAETVVRDRVAAWGSDPKMATYLRPMTIFGPKFDSYLQATNGHKTAADAAHEKRMADVFGFDSVEAYRKYERRDAARGPQIAVLLDDQTA